MSLTHAGDACAHVHQNGRGKYIKIGSWFIDHQEERVCIKLDTLPLAGPGAWAGWINLFKRREAAPAQPPGAQQPLDPDGDDDIPF